MGKIDQHSYFKVVIEWALSLKNKFVMDQSKVFTLYAL